MAKAFWRGVISFGMVAIELVTDRETKEPAAKETALLRKKCYENK